MIALLENEFVEKKKYIEKDEFLDMVAIAESTPGPIAINAATYLGYKHRAFLGSLVATVGVVIPSFVIIFAISRFLDNFLEITLIANAFKGIKLAVGLLILNAGLNMLQKMKKTKQSIVFLVCATCVMLLAQNFSALSLMIIAGVVSLALSLKKGGKA